jgi:hypothetical protein
MVFISNNQAPEVLKPGKEPFDFPSTPITLEFPAILAWFIPSLAMRSFQRHAHREAVDQACRYRRLYRRYLLWPQPISLHGAKLPSMNASRISMSPRLCRSSTNSLTMLLKTPCLTHCWNRLWQVWYADTVGVDPSKEHRFVRSIISRLILREGRVLCGPWDLLEGLTIR